MTCKITNIKIKLTECQRWWTK